MRFGPVTAHYLHCYPCCTNSTQTHRERERECVTDEVAIEKQFTERLHSAVQQTVLILNACKASVFTPLIVLEPFTVSFKLHISSKCAVVCGKSTI